MPPAPTNSPFAGPPPADHPLCRTPDFPSAHRLRPPRPVEAFDIPLPTLPPHLEGLTILHIADLHIRVQAPGRRSFLELLKALAVVPADLVVLTGDYMDQPGHEPAALEMLRQVLRAARPGSAGSVLGIFGNHDTLDFQKAARELPGIRWLDNVAADVDIPGRGSLRVLGLSWPEDPLAAALSPSSPVPGAQSPVPFLLTLAHMPGVIFPAADLGLPLVLAGHTHAGQVRFSPRSAPHTSSDTPSHLASGTLRLRDTLLCISRGLGEAVFEGARVNCPRQLPLYALRRGPLPATPDPMRVAQVIAW